MSSTEPDRVLNSPRGTCAVLTRCGDVCNQSRNGATIIVPEKMSLSDFVSRRLHPVKVTISLLRHELTNHTKGDVTEMSKHLLNSAVSTLELFVEDYEKLIGASAKPSATIGERKFVEDVKPSLLPTG